VATGALPPPKQPRRRLAHIRLRAAVAEPQEPVAAGAVEIHARRRSHAQFRQHAGAEGDAVVGALGDVGEQVERALRRAEAIEPRFRQRAQQVLAGAAVARHVGLQFVVAVERRLGGDLGDVRGADEQVLRQALHRAHQVLGQDQPADAPAGHAEVFGETVSISLPMDLPIMITESFRSWAKPLSPMLYHHISHDPQECHQTPVETLFDQRF